MEKRVDSMSEFLKLIKDIEEKLSLLESEEDRFELVNNSLYPNVFGGLLVDEVNDYRLKSIDSYNTFTLSNIKILSDLADEISDMIYDVKNKFGSDSVYAFYINNYERTIKMHNKYIMLLSKNQTATTRFTDREVERRYNVDMQKRFNK